MFAQPSAKDLSPERRDTVKKLSTQLGKAYLYQTDQQLKCHSDSSDEASIKETTKFGPLQRLTAVQQLSDF